MRATSRLAGRVTFVCLAALTAVQPLDGQQQELKRPDGWTVRPDRPGTPVEDVYFVDMPPGWHVTTGPAVILYDPALRAGGDFRVEMEVFLFDPQGRREAFGFFTGGADLDGEGQRYTYFLIREGGQFLLKKRDGNSTETVTNWTAHPAIHSFADIAAGEATVRNVMVLEAHGDQVRLLVNDQEVASLPREGLDLDGVVGLRVNHGLNLHVSKVEVTPLS